MSILLIFTIGLFFVFLGKFLFKRWYNHLSLYALIWMVMLVLYEVRLIQFEDLRLETWIVITLAFFSYLFGILTIFLGKNIYSYHTDNHSLVERETFLFIDDGKSIKFLIISLSLIGFYSGYQHWSVLISKFGSVLGVLVNATTYYRMRVAGEIKGVIPYIFISSYIAIFFSGLYTAYKKKLTFVATLPILAVIFKETANLGRAGILLGLVEFVTVFILFRYFLSQYQKKEKPKRKNVFVAITIVLILTVGAATIIKIIRKPIENIQGTSMSLKRLEDNPFISPSIYLYTCSHVGVLNKYLEKDNERTLIGQHTFLPIYNLLSKFEVVEHPPFFQKGYFIPIWTNTGTYLREIDADFGKGGILFIPYLLGLITTYFWFRFFKKGDIINLVILIYLYLIIIFSFLVMISRLSSWFISFILLVILVPVFEKVMKVKYSSVD